jgi:2-C-methyl-D-erythritol 4-phosphate cytidylyltransferase
MPDAKKPRSAAAVLVAAGSSTRIGGSVRKPYLELRGRAILTWAVESLAQLDFLDQLVLVTRPDDRQRAMDAARAAKIPARLKLTSADGGKRRQDSVFNGLKAVDAHCEVVLIHDAARPFPPKQAMEQACERAMEIGGAILASRAKDTVKREASATKCPPGEALIETTVPRKDLWLAHTPQVFQRELILGLYERLTREAPSHDVTDDASVCELFGQAVALIPSSETNMKVTSPEDLLIAESFLNFLQTR